MSDSDGKVHRQRVLLLSVQANLCSWSFKARKRCERSTLWSLSWRSGSKPRIADTTC
jgi:hypothetical protein